MLLALDIGGSAIKAALSPRPGSIDPIGSIPTPGRDRSAFLAAIAGIVPAAVERVAVSITGCLDPHSRRLRVANIPCIDGTTLEDLLAQSLGRPVRVANDADCFALAEATLGAGRGHRTVFGIILGTGVGGGVVIDGRILEGAGGIAGEWGHGPVVASIAGDPPAVIPRFACGCGQTGCLDTVGGARGLERLHALLSGEGRPSTEIVALFEAGNAVAVRTVSVLVDLLAGPLAMAVNLLGSSIVPAGGGLARSAPLVAALDAAVRRQILRRTREPLVVPARCAGDPGLLGAAILGWAEIAP